MARTCIKIERYIGGKGTGFFLQDPGFLRACAVFFFNGVSQTFYPHSTLMVTLHPHGHMPNPKGRFQAHPLGSGEPSKASAISPQILLPVDLRESL